MNTDVAWVALGSNVGNRGRALAALRDHLGRGGVRIEAASTEILTRPVGVTGQGDFHNQVLRLRAPSGGPPNAGSSTPAPPRWLRAGVTPTDGARAAPTSTSSCSGRAGR